MLPSNVNLLVLQPFLVEKPQDSRNSPHKRCGMPSAPPLGHRASGGRQSCLADCLAATLNFMRKDQRACIDLLFALSFDFRLFPLALESRPFRSLRLPNQYKAHVGVRHTALSCDAATGALDSVRLSRDTGPTLLTTSTLTNCSLRKSGPSFPLHKRQASGDSDRWLRVSLAFCLGDRSKGTPCDLSRSEPMQQILLK